MSPVIVVLVSLLPLLISTAACNKNHQISELIQRAFSSTTSGFNQSSIDCSRSTSSLSSSSRTEINLNLSSRNLSGVVSWNYLLNLTNLVSVDLSNNSLKGSIPPNFWSIPSLLKVNLSNNHFGGGVVHQNSGSSSSIRVLSLSNNRFTNTVELSGFSNLRYLDLSGNDLRALPSGISDLTGLEDLDLSGCNISGDLEKSISGLKSLKRLDVSRNRLRGEFPADFPSLARLRYLNISHNNFTGRMPRRDQISRFGLSAFSHSGIQGTTSSSTWNTNTTTVPPAMAGVHSESAQHRNHAAPAASTTTTSTKRQQQQKKKREREKENKKKYGSAHGHPSNLSARRKYAHHKSSSSRLKSNKAFIIGVSIGCSALLIILVGSTTVICCASCRLRRRRRTKWSISKPMVGTSSSSSSALKEKSGPFSFSTGSGSSWVADIREPGSAAVVMFDKPLMSLTFKDLITATSAFGKESQLGEGPVYRGVLQPGEIHVAIKVLESARGMEEEEAVAMFEELARVRHPNLLPISGYCIAGKEKLILYEFMANGDLHGWLHELLPGESNVDDWATDTWDYHDNNYESAQHDPSPSNKLNWATRHRIALGVARGLAFLHHALARPVVHGHLVPSNILLSDDLEPRIVDFGLHHHQYPGGQGYDVYSFGLVLMELLTGKPIMNQEGQEEMVRRVRKLVRDGKGVKAIDQRLVRLVDEEEEEAIVGQLVECLRVAYLCTAEVPGKRPTMQQVVGMLKDVHPMRP